MSSKSSSTTATGTDQSNVLTGLAQQGAINGGYKSNVNLQTGGIGGSLNAATGSNIYFADPKLADTFAATVKDINATSAGAFKSIGQSLSEAIGGVTSGLPNPADLNAEPPGLLDRVKRVPWLVWLGLLAVAGVGWWLWRRK